MAGRKPDPPEWQQYERWSDGETSALIDAWAPLHLRHCSHYTRPRIPNKEWRLVAADVNGHRAATAGRRLSTSGRTVAQCQRRIKKLLKDQPSSGRFARRLRALLGGPPAAKSTTPASVEKDKADQVMDDGEEVYGGGLAGTSRPAVKPRNGFSAAAAAVVMKLAEVYERVEMAALEAEKERIKAEMGRNRKACSCSCDYT